MTKELVKENVTRHEGSQEKAPSPRRIDLRVGEGWGEGFTHNDKYEPRPCGCNTRKLVNNRFPARKGWGLRDGKPQSLIHDKNLTSYRLNVLTTFKKAAFTLAEVLVTLGVIGVVAAMTIPNLVQSYKEKVTVTKLKKTYAVLANAFKMAEYENGSLSDQFGDNVQTNAQKIYEYIAPYIKTSKVCGFNSGCLTSGYIKNLNGTKYRDYDNMQTEFKFVMADGVDVWVYMKMGSTDDEYIGNIKVDIDGKAGEYTFGKDVFIFTISKNHGLYPAGRANDVSVDNEFDTYCNLSAKQWGNGAACAAWVIYNENLDYLHCDDLSWDGKHKCSD